MAFAALLMVALVLFMLAGAVPAAGGHQTVVFRTPAFIALAAVFAGALVRCSLRGGLAWRRAGFVALHLGMVLVLAGGLLGFLRGRHTECAIPVAGHHAVRELPTRDGGTLALDFGITVTNFHAEFYPPTYSLWTLAAPTGAVDAAADPRDAYRYRAKVAVPPEGGALDLHGHPDTVRAEDLRDPGSRDAWAAQHVLSDGAILQRNPATPRRYTADIVLTGDGGARREATLAVNAPASHRGWRIYLMSYDQEAQRYVVLKVRRDPGRPLVIGGIWAVIAGVVPVCFRRREGGRRAPG